MSLLKFSLAATNDTVIDTTGKAIYTQTSGGFGTQITITDVPTGTVTALEDHSGAGWTHLLSQAV